MSTPVAAVLVAYSLTVTALALWLRWRLKHTERLLAHERMNWRRFDESRRRHPSYDPQAD